jgi:hypothetical protein
MAVVLHSGSGVRGWQCAFYDFYYLINKFLLRFCCLTPDPRFQENFMRSRTFWSLVLLASSAVFPRGFSTEPPATPIDATVSFDIGQGAVNSFLHEAFKTQTTHGSGATRVIIVVKTGEVSLVQNSAALRLEFFADYDLDVAPKRANIILLAPVNSGNLAYMGAEGLQLALGSVLDAQISSLPSYVRSVLTSKFNSVKLYPGKYQGTTTGLGATVPVGVRTQIDDKFPIFYMGEGQWSISLLPGALRVSMGPMMEREKPLIQFYRRAIGSTSNWGGEELKSELTVITNFKGTILKVGYECGDDPGTPCSYDGSGDGTVVADGPFNLIKQSGTDSRYRRFNYIGPIVLNGMYSGEIWFWVEIQHGNIRYIARALVKHNTNGYGSNHTSGYLTVHHYYNS